MFRKIFFCVLIFCTVLSCREYGSLLGDNSGERGSSDNPGDLNYNSDSSCSSGGNDWGGISCQGNSDEGFKNFLTSGTIVDQNSEDLGYKKVECQPGNNKGIIFHLSLDFGGNATVDLNGDNQNLTLGRNSTMRIRVVDRQPLNIELQVANGEINGNQAKFEFTDEYGSIILEGTFDSQFFTGQVEFKNERELVDIKENQEKEYIYPGREGILGDFKISSCSAFSSP